MAGIGFELKRVLGRSGNLTSTVQALAGGVFIVAGPWLLTILTMVALNQWAGESLSEGPLTFQAAVTYTYAFSLVLMGPLHFWFTRIVSDLLWEERPREASWLLIWVLLGAVTLSAVLTGVLISGLPLTGLRDAAAFRWAWIALAATVNGLWVIMLFVSVLKWFGRILVVYTLGMALGLALMSWWGLSFGIAGALAGLAAGHGLIILGLMGLCWAAHFPQPPQQPRAETWSSLLEHQWLVWGGFAYGLGIWTDKISFWFLRGTTVEGSGLFLFPVYDLIVYAASLSLIPGLLFFVVFTETSFAVSVLRFSQSLLSRPYREIRKRQFELIHLAGTEWRRLALFQAVVVLGVLTLLSLSAAGFNLPFAVGLAGSWAQLLLLAVLTFHYFLQQYRDAALVSFLFVGLGAGGMVVQTLVPQLPPGTSYFFANALCSLVGLASLQKRMRSIDRILYQS